MERGPNTWERALEGLQWDVPEITEACWEILGVDPASVMCATSRMVVKRKGEDHPVVVPCTLRPYDPHFEMGRTLSESTGSVKLNHPHCARFCVLVVDSCSAPTPQYLPAIKGG